MNETRTQRALAQAWAAWIAMLGRARTEPSKGVLAAVGHYRKRIESLSELRMAELHRGSP